MYEVWRLLMSVRNKREDEIYDLARYVAARLWFTGTNPEVFKARIDTEWVEW
jgi:hypothetical protein